MKNQPWRLALAAAALVFSIPVLADTQACDDEPEQYEDEGGTATGQGVSPGRALTNASQNKTQQVQMAMDACNECPGGDECSSSTQYDWDNVQYGTPVWDPILMKYTVSVSWDGCTLTQWCHPCSISDPH